MNTEKIEVYVYLKTERGPNNNNNNNNHTNNTNPNMSWILRKDWDPTADWWAHLHAEYPALVPFYKAKYEFLNSISPLHTRLEEICIETDEYTHVAIKTRPPHRIPAVYEDLIGEALRHYGLEADSYSLLLDLERAYSEALVWIAAQMRCDLFLMDAFLTDEHADYRLDALFLLPPRRKKLKPSEVGEKRGGKQ